MHRAVIAPTRSPGIEPGWAGFRGIDRAIVLDRVSSLLAEGASMMAPVELLTAMCEAAAPHLALTNVVLFKRVAGQSRTLAWAAPGVSGSRRLAARERAWSGAAALVDHEIHEVGVSPRSERGSEIASVSIEDPRLGLSVMLSVESRRALDGQDRWLIEEILRRMMGLPAAPEQ